MSTLSQADLISAQTDFADLLNTVRVKEGHLALTPQATGPATHALENLGKTRISFGHPRDSLVRLKPALFKAVGLQLDAMQAAIAKNEYFYYLTLAVSMVPGDAVQYEQIKCELELGPSGDDAPIIHTMFPAAEWKKVMEWGAGLSLGLNADLSWSAVLDPMDPLQLGLFNQLPAELKAKVQNKNEYKGYIAFPAFSFQLGRADIAATGVGNTFGYWDIQKPDLKQVQTVKFGLVFKVPKSVTKVSLVGKATAQTSKNWLFSNLKPLFNSLKPEQQDRVTKGLPLGDYKEWELVLPD